MPLHGKSETMLLSLPSEVLTIIFDHAIHCVGIRSGIRLRLVCRIFNEYIQDAIYALPTFENPDDDSPDYLTFDRNMSDWMVTRLIQTKLKSHQQERALTREIIRTSSFAADSLSNVDEEIYRNTLARLAAESLPLYEIIQGLSKDSSRPDAISSLLENALTAAVSLDRGSHVQDLFDLGARALNRTKWFGDVFLIAARHAATKTFWSVLSMALKTDHPVVKRLTAARLIMALENAAAHGRADAFCEDLWPFITQTYEEGLVLQVFEPALRSAAVVGHESVVFAIFDLLKSHKRKFLNESKDTFWVEVLRLAASNGSASIVQLVLNNTAISKVCGSMNLPLEDACRVGHKSIVELLIAHHTERSPGSCAGSFYWAGREARYDIVRLLVKTFERSYPSCLGDVLCGAAVRGTSGMAAVFDIVDKWASAKKGLDLKGKTFAQVIDTVFTAGLLVKPKIQLAPRNGASRIGSSHDEIFQDLLSEEHLQLAKAAREGRFGAVYAVIARYRDEDMAASHYSGGAFSESIGQQHPGILAYLCEKFSRNRHFTSDAALDIQSTAIFQILLDHGWAVDTPSSNKFKPPILGEVTKSEELTRWLLQHGSNPNSRGDWDITPLSVAVGRASLSTIRMLLKRGGDVSSGQLLHFAVRRKSPDQLAVIDMLLGFGAPLDARMFENDPAAWVENRYLGLGTPLHKAVEDGNAIAAAHLLWRGASCEVLDSAGRTVLDLAKQQRNQDIVEMIESRCTNTHD